MCESYELSASAVVMDATEQRASINLRSVGKSPRSPLNRTIASLLTTAALLVSTGSAASERAFFRSPPTRVSLHNPAAIEKQRNRTTISVAVPEDAGSALQEIVMYQIGSTERWDWGRKPPELYYGSYGLRRKGEAGLAVSSLSEEGHELTIRLEPPIEPGKQVNLVFRGINPEPNIYMWATSFVPAGTNPLSSDGPTLRQHVYRNDDFN